MVVVVWAMPSAERFSSFPSTACGFPRISSRMSTPSSTRKSILPSALRFAPCRAAKSEIPASPRTTASPSITNEVFPEPERGLDDQGVTVGAIIAAAGQQPHALVLARYDQAIAVIDRKSVV